MTEFEAIIRQITADYRRNRGLPPLASDMTIPASIRKPEPVEPPEPSLAMRLIGREICQETRKLDERECRRAFNARSEK